MLTKEEIAHLKEVLGDAVFDALLKDFPNEGDIILEAADSGLRTYDNIAHYINRGNS